MAKRTPPPTAPDSAEPVDAPAPSFESALARLTEIVGRIEGEPLELDESLALFEEGVRLLRTAQGVLDSADGRIRQLLEDGAGGHRFTEFAEQP
jgi:exodeoxyribonuclease VII small subunit